MTLILRMLCGSVISGTWCITGMCMISDRHARLHRWFRDPTVPLPRHEVTRFPHAVLEVKLSLPEGHKPPDWVSGLISSGMLTEVCLTS